MSKVEVLRGQTGKVSYYDAFAVAKEHRGWPLGAFVTDENGEPLTDEFEIKLAHLKEGDERYDWSAGRHGVAISIVLEGIHEFSVALDGLHGDIVTRELHAGMAVFWQNTVPHRWRAVTDSTIITIRRLSR